MTLSAFVIRWRPIGAFSKRPKGPNDSSERSEDFLAEIGSLHRTQLPGLDGLDGNAAEWPAIEGKSAKRLVKT